MARLLSLLAVFAVCAAMGYAQDDAVRVPGEGDIVVSEDDLGQDEVEVPVPTDVEIREDLAEEAQEKEFAWLCHWEEELGRYTKIAADRAEIPEIFEKFPFDRCAGEACANGAPADEVDDDCNCVEGLTLTPVGCQVLQEALVEEEEE
eukprot:m.57462 g.57462  ORF g.57462 m.57462 type:complete len:148 (+) comp11598_c0_seq2:491-934(+)